MKRILASGICIVGLMLTTGVFAQDDGFRDGQPNFLHPRNGSSISEHDVVSVLYTDGCGANELNPDIAPFVSRDGNRIEIDLTIKPNSMPPFCFAARPPAKEWVIPLGHLPKGSYEIVRGVYAPAPPFGQRELLSLLSNTVRVGDTPHLSVSGTWFDPGNPGSGFVINVLPLGADEVEPQAMIFTAALDNGQPTWLLGLGRFENGVLRVTSKTGGNGAEQRQSFRYDGCGHITYVDEAFPTFSYSLEQLTSVAGVESCEPVGTVLLPAAR